MLRKDWSLRHDDQQHFQFPAFERSPTCYCSWSMTIGHSWTSYNCSAGNVQIKTESNLIVLIDACIVIYLNRSHWLLLIAWHSFFAMIRKCHQLTRSYEPSFIFNNFVTVAEDRITRSLFFYVVR